MNDYDSIIKYHDAQDALSKTKTGGKTGGKTALSYESKDQHSNFQDEFLNFVNTQLKSVEKETGLKGVALRREVKKRAHTHVQNKKAMMSSSEQHNDDRYHGFHKKLDDQEAKRRKLAYKGYDKHESKYIYHNMTTDAIDSAEECNHAAQQKNDDLRGKKKHAKSQSTKLTSSKAGNGKSKRKQNDADQSEKISLIVFFNKMDQKMLKECCAKNKLHISGTKKDLIDRLMSRIETTGGHEHDMKTKGDSDIKNSKKDSEKDNSDNDEDDSDDSNDSDDSDDSDDIENDSDSDDSNSEDDGDEDEDDEDEDDD